MWHDSMWSKMVSGACGLGVASVPEFDNMWHKLADSPQVLQQMFSLPYTNAVLEGLEANPSLGRQVQLHSNNSSLAVTYQR